MRHPVSSLGRHVGRSPASPEEIRDGLREAWVNGMLPAFILDDVKDPWVRQVIINEANRLYGETRRKAG